MADPSEIAARRQVLDLAVAKWIDGDLDLPGHLACVLRPDLELNAAHNAVAGIAQQRGVVEGLVEAGSSDAVVEWAETKLADQERGLLCMPDLDANYRSFERHVNSALSLLTFEDNNLRVVS